MKTENLINKEAIQKLQSIAEENQTCMMLTHLEKQPIDANPMHTKKVHEDGTFWFLSPLNSSHNMNIQVDSSVQLLFSDIQNDNYLSVYGEATIETRHTILQELYSKDDDRWFDGVDDPNLTAIKVLPKEAYYWDKSQNKFLKLIEETIEAVTGNENDHYTKGKMRMD